jgi:hypothetical protein
VINARSAAVALPASLRSNAVTRKGERAPNIASWMRSSRHAAIWPAFSCAIDSISLVFSTRMRSNSRPYNHLPAAAIAATIASSATISGSSRGLRGGGFTTGVQALCGRRPSLAAQCEAGPGRDGMPLRGLPPEWAHPAPDSNVKTSQFRVAPVAALNARAATG